MSVQGNVSPKPTTSSRPIWFYGVVAVSLVVLALLAMALIRTQQGQVSSGPAPDFTLETFEGETLRLSDFRGTPVVINFWASWCVECYREAPLLEQTWRRYKGQVMFIGVDYVDTLEPALEYIDRYDITYPNGMDKGNRIADAYRIQGVPETFFVDREGNIAGVKIGPLEHDELEQWMQRLLQE